MTPPDSPLVHLLPALQRLDRLLERCAAQAPTAYGSEAASDPYRGLYVSRADVDRLLTRAPGASPFDAGGESDAEGGLMPAADGSPLSWLVHAFGLTPFDVDVVTVALAPELDLRYERLYAYLQDDVTRKRPTVDLVLNLLCASADQKLMQRARFAADAPLFRHQLVHLFADASALQTAAARPLSEARRAGGAGSARNRRPRSAAGGVLQSGRADGRTRAARRAAECGRSGSLVRDGRRTQRAVRLYFCGPPGAGMQWAAEALARDAGMRLLVADLARAIALDGDLDVMPILLPREAWLHDAILCLENLDIYRAERPHQADRLIDAVGRDRRVTIMSGSAPWRPDPRQPLGVVEVPFELPDFAARQIAWCACLTQAGITLAAEDRDALASCFRLLPTQIADAVATASDSTRWQCSTPQSAGEPQSVTLRELRAAARAQSGHDLGKLARKIDARYGWDDLVLPADAVAQLCEMCERVAYQSRVLGDWGFGRKLATGKSVNALFAGPSGTGKTMAAEVIANELGLDLYAIDLSGVVSKYIGETEKNLDRIFTVAENANAILFFDEADALFGKRSEVRDSHDRYANIEIAYLLQKMDRYDGIAILASNLKSNLDDSFTRRLSFTIHFPFPDEACRQQIWARVWPSEVPRATSVDATWLARQFTLSGGNIRNVALAAAFMAAGDGQCVTQAHVLRAVRREFQKMGRSLSDIELGRMGAEQAASG